MQIRQCLDGQQGDADAGTRRMLRAVPKHVDVAGRMRQPRARIRPHLPEALQIRPTMLPICIEDARLPWGSFRTPRVTIAVVQCRTPGRWSRVETGALGLQVPAFEQMLPGQPDDAHAHVGPLQCAGQRHGLAIHVGRSEQDG